MKFYAFSSNNNDIGSGLCDTEEAARAMLTYDGFEYEIRNEDGEFKLFVSRFSRNSGIGSKDKAEWPKYAATTEAGVYANVVEMGGVQGTYAQSEEDYNRMLAEAE